MTEAVLEKVADTTTTTQPIVDKAAATTDASKTVDTTTTDTKVAAAAKVVTEAGKVADTATKTADTKVEGEKEIGSTLPDNWREIAADGDEALLKELKRYGGMKGVAKALADAKAMIRSGKVVKAQPDAADTKAMAEWRKEQDIPEDVAGYKPPEIKGHTWSDEDKPALALYFEKAHAKGLPQSMLDANLEIYASMQQDLQERQVNFDKQQHSATEDALRKDWAGGEYRQNMALAKAWIERSPIGPEWSAARLPDGRTLASMPEFILWASDMGRQELGAVALAGDVQSKATARREEIRAMRTANPEKYNTPAIQSEERALIDAELKSKRATR